MTNITMKNFITAAALTCSITTTSITNAAIVGLWEFENSSSLTAATTGTDLAETGVGFTAVAGSGGSDTGAVQVALGSYYSMDHGIAVSAGDTYLNQYTILIDFKLDTATTNTWTTFFQTNTTNTGDADYFFNKGAAQELGVFSENYVGNTGTVSLDQWHRLVVSVDQGGDSSTYLDGTFIGTHAPSVADGRWSLDTSLIIFGDNDGDDGVINVSTVAMYDQALNETTVQNLAGAGESTAIPEPASALLLGAGLLALSYRKQK